MRDPESDRESGGERRRGSRASSAPRDSRVEAAASTLPHPRTRALPPELSRILAEFRAEARRRTFLAALLAAILALALAYLVVFALERRIDTPAALRGAIAAGAALVAAVGFPRWVIRSLLGLSRDEQVARRIGRRDLIAGDRLLGAIDLARGTGDAASGRSERLVEAAIAQVEREIGARDLSRALPPPRHRRLARAAAFPVAAAIGLAMIWPEASANTLARFTGLGSAPRWTFARIGDLSGEWVVPRGEALAREVELAPGSRSRPARATLRLSGGDALEATLEGSRYRFGIPPRAAEEELALRVGDLVRGIRLRPVDRPELLELVARADLPAYLGLPERISADLRSGGATFVAGSAVGFTARATRPLAGASLDGRPAGVSGDRIEGDSAVLEGDRAHTLEWRDEHGLSGARPVRFALRARADEPPAVSIRDLPRESVALVSETITFRIEAGDDFGVGEVGLRYEGIPDRADNPSPSAGEKRVAAGGPAARTLGAPATFCAARLGIHPQSVELRATARDAFPGRTPSLSTPFTVHVLSEEEHMVWLTGELGRWLREAAEVRDREEELHRGNRELRALGEDELDRPGVRKRLEEQAIAERANAARLDRLGARGEDLLARAARNPEFNAPTMEEWAERVRALRAIAAERMPSVADLLARAADAPSGASSSKKPDGEIARADGAEGSPGGEADATSSESPEGEGSSSSDRGEAGRSGERPGPTPLAAGEPVPGAAERPPGAGDPERADVLDEEELARLAREKESGRGLRHGESENAAGNGSAANGAKPALPGVSDVASSLAPPGATSPTTATSSSAAAGPGLVETVVPGAAPPAPGESDSAAAPPSETMERLESAIAEQSELLAAFDDALDELAAVMRDLEGSTFVKRLKEASREQLRIAGALAPLVESSFGTAHGSVSQETRVRLEESAALEWSSSERLTRIQGDMEAFVLRTERATHQRVLAQMKETAVTAELNEAARAVERNHGGDTIARAELWADTLDRWADELVGPG